MKIQPSRFVQGLLCLSFLFTAAVGVAHAELIRDEDTIPTTFLPIDAAMEVAQFDPAQGILTSVEVTATVNLTGTFAYENPLDRPTSLEGSVGGEFELQLPGAVTLGSTVDIIAVNETLPALGSGEQAFAPRLVDYTAITSPALLGAFAGTGVVSLPTRVYARWQAAGVNSNVDISLRTTGDAHVDVVYNYAIPRIELQKLTNDVDADRADQADVPQLAPGAPVVWTYLVKNTGTVAVPLAQVTLVDSDAAVTPVFVPASDTGGDALLSPGETWRYTAAGTALDLLDTVATQGSDIVAGCSADGAGLYGTRNTYANLATVTVPGAEAEDPSHYCNPPAPAIDIETSTNGIDADDADDPAAPILAPASPANWVYVVRNDGNVHFTVDQVVVTDTYPGVTPVFDPAGDDGDGILSPGEMWTYTATRPALNLTDDDTTRDATIVPGCGVNETPFAYENVGHVVVPGAADSDPTHYCNTVFPAIDIETSTNGVDADDPSDPATPVLAIGAAARWVYAVRNDGNISFTVADVVVTDSYPGVTPVFDPASDDGDGILSPTETWRYRATGTALDLDDADVTRAGTIVLGCGTRGLRNTYENVGTVVVPGADDTDPTHYCNPANPAIDIETSTNGVDGDAPDDPAVPILPIATPANWVYIVRNDGNVTFSLDAVEVTDSHPGVTPVFDPNSDDGDGLLSPGEHWRFDASNPALDLDDAAATGDSTIVLGCSATGTRNTYENVGRVVVPGDEDADPTHYCGPANPAVDIEKATNGADADDPAGGDVPTTVPGATVIWSYVVTNRGNVTFARDDVTVADSDRTLAVQWVASSDDGDGLLSPGESWRYGATATALDLLDPAVTSGVTVVDGCDAYGTGTRPTYRNVATVTVPGADDRDASHYCNLTPTAVELVGFRAAPVNNGIELSWRTAVRATTLGFHVLRSPTPHVADAVTVTPTMVMAELGAGDGMQAFTVTDVDATPNTLHYYWLAEIELSGRRIIHGPVTAIVYDPSTGYLMYLPLANKP